MGRTGRLWRGKNLKGNFPKAQNWTGKRGKSEKQKRPQKKKEQEKKEKPDSKLIPFEPTQSEEAKPAPVTSEETGEKNRDGTSST